MMGQTKWPDFNEFVYVSCLQPKIVHFVETIKVIIAATKFIDCEYEMIMP